MTNSGKFNTSTKTKISTPHGNILKIIHYNSADEEQQHSEYKIKPKCSICGGNASCICYNDDNSDDPFQSAIDGLQKTWCCEKLHCICEFMKTIYSNRYEKLAKMYNDDEYAIYEALQEMMSEEDDYGIFCEV